MSGNSNIEWTDASWNPVTGCTKVSPGCSRCYAETIDHRFDHDKVGKLPWAFPPSRGGRGVTLHPERLDWPLKQTKPMRIFVNSMSDLFHEDVPMEFINQVYMVMAQAYWHTFQILTKRPRRRLQFFDWLNSEGQSGPLNNTWEGVSVENQLWADRRIRLLLQTPASVLFLSCEPLLSNLDLYPWLPYTRELAALGGYKLARGCLGLNGILDRLNWVITGGESGPKRRPADPDWFRSIRDQCVAAGVPYFHKQGNAFKPGQDRMLDGVEWNQFPEISHA